MIRIVYIDDRPDATISSYLLTYTSLRNASKPLGCEDEFEYIEQEFKNESMDVLLNSDYVIKSNVIIIDSRLYENSTVGAQVLTGEQFQMVLRRVNPFIEVIVISQNENTKAVNLVKKARKSDDSDPNAYYGKELGGVLDNLIDNLLIARNTVAQLGKNTNIDKAVRESVENLLSGTYQYQTLKTADVDELVKSIKELELQINV